MPNPAETSQKKSLDQGQGYKIRLHSFCPNWVQIVFLPQKNYFGKIDCYHCTPTVYLHATTFKKNRQRANHKKEGCIIVAKIGSSLLPQSDIFWKS